MTWDDVLAVGLALPGMDASTSYGTPALKVGGKLVARLRPEDDSLVLIGVPPDERDLLIAVEPGIFHVTPHYDGHPIVLARLAALDADRLRPFLERRWRAVTPKRVAAGFADATPPPAAPTRAGSARRRRR